MGRIERPDALRVRPLEAVNRLIIVADHGEIAVFAEEVDQLLLRAAQILVLVDQDVVVRMKLRRLRIVLEVVEGDRHQLADQHRLVPSERAEQGVPGSPGRVRRLVVPVIGLPACPR